MGVGRLASGGAGGRGEEALADAAEELKGADEEAQAGLARTFVGQPVCALVAFDAHVGRHPVDVHMPVFERGVIQLADRIDKCAVGPGLVVFGDRYGRVCAISE